MTERKYASEIETYAESPQRQLRRELGLGEKSGPKRARVDDWFPFKLGQHVRRKDGDKRVGEVVAWFHWTVVVKWPNGKRDHISLDALESAETPPRKSRRKK